MRHSFSILLTVCILMIIGMALVPGLDISNKPRPQQGKTLNISYYWQGTSAKVVEQNVTSRSEEHTSELQSRQYLVCRLLLEKKKKNINQSITYPTTIYTKT